LWTRCSTSERQPEPATLTGVLPGGLLTSTYVSANALTTMVDDLVRGVTSGATAVAPAKATLRQLNWLGWRVPLGISALLLVTAGALVVLGRGQHAPRPHTLTNN
ncbi:MAG: hypothetical protein WCT12_30610, partial [Verrucomicrobiota bacterium]